MNLALQQNYTVVDAFEDTNGKFGNTLGNVALVDCKTFPKVFQTSYNMLRNDLLQGNPAIGLFAFALDQ